MMQIYNKYWDFMRAKLIRFKSLKSSPLRSQTNILQSFYRILHTQSQLFITRFQNIPVWLISVIWQQILTHNTNCFIFKNIEVYERTREDLHYFYRLYDNYSPNGKWAYASYPSYTLKNTTAHKVHCVQC